jgi:hypothetical protein
LTLIKKETNFGAKVYPMPAQISNSQGRSATFSNAQANITTANLREFMLTRVKDYSIAQLDTETMLASEKDSYAFIEAAKLVIDSAWQASANSLGAALYRSGTGSIGSIGSINGSGVITLAAIADVVQFELDMTLQANATDGGGAPRGTRGRVTAVDRYNGLITVVDPDNGGVPAGWVTGDFLLVQGDNNARIKGLDAWLPRTAPAAGESFFGVDRSVDTRLQGLRINGSNMSIEEAIIDAANFSAREGATPDHLFTNYASYSSLIKSLGSKVQFVNDKYANIGFEGVRLQGPTGQIKVYPDRNCPSLTAYLLSLDTWVLKSLGDAPRVLDFGAEGSNAGWLRMSSADAAELRIGYFAQMGCKAPGKNAVISLSA